EPAATALALARKERRESGGDVRRIAAWYGMRCLGALRAASVEWQRGIQTPNQGRRREAADAQGQREWLEEDEGLRELRPVPRGPAAVPSAHHPRAAQVRPADRARAAGVREV